MAKNITFGDEARKQLKHGIDQVANAVRITIGPKGRNVILDKGYGTPTITNDGVSIAKDISLKDKVANMGAEIIKEVAQKTNDVAGDGTTTAVVLTQAIITNGYRLSSFGLNPLGLSLGIKDATKRVVAKLQTLSKQIKNKEEIKQVATIAAESDEFGAIIAETIEKVGKNGVVTVEESQTFGVESELVEGMQFDKGYASPYMITDAERMEAEYNDPDILLTDKKISSVKELLPLLEKLAQKGRKQVVIIAEDVDGEALTTLIVNKLRASFNSVAIKAPGFGDRRKEMLEDLAVLTGGEVISEERGLKLENADLKHLGRARKVVVTKDNTTIVGGAGKKADIEERVAQIKKEWELSDSKYDKEKLQERLGKLSGGVAVIKVGAATEAEMKYLKLKIEDAVNATKAAIEEGIVPGGGSALILARKLVEEEIKEKQLKAPSKELAKEFVAGTQILLESLEQPFRQIARNSGKEDIGHILKQVTESKSGGYNAVSDEFVPDMFAAGIIDPVKVTRTGLERAASAAAILLTTEAAVTDEPKEEKEVAGGGLPGGMGGMGGMDY